MATLTGDKYLIIEVSQRVKLPLSLAICFLTGLVFSGFHEIRLIQNLLYCEIFWEETIGEILAPIKVNGKAPIDFNRARISSIISCTDPNITKCSVSKIHWSRRTFQNFSSTKWLLFKIIYSYSINTPPMSQWEDTKFYNIPI